MKYRRIIYVAILLGAGLLGCKKEDPQPVSTSTGTTNGTTTGTTSGTTTKGTTTSGSTTSGSTTYNTGGTTY